MALPVRKHPRLKEYDYCRNGAYFATICAKNHAHVFGAVRGDHAPAWVELSEVGKIADQHIRNISVVYKTVRVEKYVIMPNHIHLLIVIMALCDEESHLSLHTIIRSFKTLVTKQIGYSIWQSSYYDRVICNEERYQDVWNYIDRNPLKWQEDELFSR